MISALALLLLVGGGVAPDTASLSVEVVAGPDGPLCSVTGANVPVDRIVREVAGRIGRTVEGFDGAARSVLVTVELDRRPVADVLEIALGAAGLRPEWRDEAVHVVAAGRDDATPARLRDLATASYASALLRFPDHPLGASARLGQAEIEERRGNLDAALDHYHALIDTYRSSPLVHRARLCAAAALERQGRYAEAADHRRRVATASGAAPWHAEARLGLARDTLHLGNADLAEAMIATLERTHPSDDTVVAAERELVRAEALLALSRWIPALHSVERSSGRGLPLALEMRAMSVRARAFEGLEMLREAARAWLIVAVHGDASERAVAYERAAQLSLEEGEELSALFVASQARAAGFDVPGLADEARLRLGLAPEGGALPLALLLVHAEQLVTEARWDELALPLERLTAERASLTTEDARRLAFARAEHAFATGGAAAALDVLRDARWEQSSDAERLPLDRKAADFLERAREFDRAVLAYEGVY